MEPAADCTLYLAINQHRIPQIMSDGTSDSESPFSLPYKYNFLSPFFLPPPTQLHHGCKHFLTPHIFPFAHMVQGDSLWIVVSHHRREELENMRAGSRHPRSTHGPQPVHLLSSALSWVVFVDLALQLLLAKQPQPCHLCRILVYCAENKTAARSFCSPMRRGGDVLRGRWELQALV